MTGAQPSYEVLVTLAVAVAALSEAGTLTAPETSALQTPLSRTTDFAAFGDETRAVAQMQRFLNQVDRVATRAPASSCVSAPST